MGLGHRRPLCGRSLRSARGGSQRGRVCGRWIRRNGAPRSAVRAAGKGSTALREGNGLVKLRDRASG